MSNVPASSRVKDGNPRKSAAIPLFWIVNLPASWIAWLVLLVSIFVTIIGWRIVQQHGQEAARTQFDVRTGDIMAQIQQRMHTYEYVLRGGAALFASSKSVEREEWHAYVTSLKIDQHLSGILGVGFAQRISFDEKDSHISHVRAEGFPAYTVAPAGQRSEYTPIVYLEPFSGRNLRAFGYDMFSEPSRRAAMERARDTGEIAVSGKVTLVQETDKEVQSGFLMYLPVYKNGQPHDTQASRRAALVGYVYSPFRMNDLMAGIVGRSIPDLDIHIYDGEGHAASSLMYDSFHEGAAQHKNTPGFSTQTLISVGGHPWTVSATSLPSFDVDAARKSPMIILIMGALISLLLFFIARVQERSRKHAVSLAEGMTKAYQVSELNLQAILDNSPYLAWFKDTEGRYIKVNRTYASYVGLDAAQQVIGKTDFDLWTKELAEKYRSDDAEVMAQRQQKQLEEPSFDGKQIHWAETFKTPVIDEEGRVLGTTGFARDITRRKLADEALRRSEIRLRTLYDSTSDAVTLRDENSFFDCNRAALAMFGCATQNELYTKHPADLSPLVQLCGTDSMTLANQKIATAMENGRCQFEWVHQRADTGQEFFAEVLLNRMELDGRMVVQATIRDITERRKAEDTLRKLSLAVEQSHSSVIITDLKANIEYVNQAFLSETGYSLGEIVGKNPRLLNSGKNPASAYQEMWACLTGGQVWKGELVNRRKDGSEYIVSLLVSPVRHADGRITHYLGVREDITERKKREAEIVRLNRAYSLLSRVNETIVRTQDSNELFTAICKAAIASELFRFVWIGMLNEKRSLVIPVAYAGVEEGYTDKLNIRLDDECTGNGPVGRAIRAEGHVICQDIENDPSMTPWRDEVLKRGYRASGVFPIREADSVVGVINIYAAETHFFTPDIIQLILELAADMSFALDVFAEKMRRKQAEDDLKQLNLELERRVQERTHQLEAANNELEAFSYSVSHDLRAPLRSIDGFSQILSKKYHDSLDDMGKSYLERVRRASQRMGHLIDDLLQLSQVTRNLLRREQIDLSAIAEKVVEDLRKMKPARQVNFVLQQGLSAYADPGLLRVVMDNLLGNAYKFTGKKADAKIEFGMSDSSGENAFFIRDNGAGFNMDYAHKLFGAFQRLHGANEFEGTGIGLATVQRIIHRHHGRVWAEAKEGQGATFYFTLPQRMRET